MVAPISKAAFARLLAVTDARVSQWLKSGVINGKAVVGAGRGALIDAKLAKRQLARRLDAAQSKACLGKPGDTLADIQRAKLAALELANAKASADALARSGRYVEADAARIEMGRLAGRMVALMDAALPELAEAVAAASNLSARDGLQILRGAWRVARKRIAAAEGEAAAALPEAAE